MNRIHPIEYYDKDLNIIGIYKLAKKVVDMKVKEAPWANFKNKNMPEYRDYGNIYNNYNNYNSYNYNSYNSYNNYDHKHENENESKWEHHDNYNNCNDELNPHNHNTINNTINNTNDTVIRDTGFSLLSNRENVTRYLKKTKFCQVLINKGECKREVCNFAHSIHEIVFPDCAFSENCKKKEKCAFKHPHETEDGYKFRIGFTIPRNIARC